MKKKRTLVSFDWALKRILRDKANFDVLEGFVTTLLGTEVKIHRLLESEGNKDRDDAKANRVDILAENAKGELLLIEVQGESEYAYFQRILFGASKLVTEYIDSGQNYENVKKVYSINIVFFDLGQGKDYVYHGKTEFRGIHENDVLKLSTFQKQQFNVSEVYQLYPEYYILKVNDFNRWSRVPLEQWIYFLSTSEIPEDADAPGLKEAREKLQLTKMSREEQTAYRRYLDDRVILADQIYTARGEGKLEGRFEGREEGLAEGRAKGREEGLKEGLKEGREEGLKEGREEGREEGRKELNIEHARIMKEKGIDKSVIHEVTGLSMAEIDHLL